jgi:hypothetical protein
LEFFRVGHFVRKKRRMCGKVLEEIERKKFTSSRKVESGES